MSLLSFVSVCVVCGLLASLLGGQKLDSTSDTTRPRKKTQQSVFRNNATARDASFSATASPSLPSRYTPPNYERTPPSRFKDRPLPVQVFEQYQKWHSVESLRRDPHHRHYSIVFYSCPNQAGNRLHHYMNSVVWSILTNRTMLWKYWDTAACQQFGRCTPPYVCQAAKTVHDCDAILSRAPWIPSYDEWHPLLFNASSSAQKNEETEVIPFQIPFHAVHPKITGRFSQNPCYPWGPGDDDTVRGVDVSYNNRTLVYFPELQYRNTYLTDPSVAHELLWSNRSRAINRKLLRFGVDFLYGMLFRNSFELTDAIRATVPKEAWHFHDNNNNDNPKERHTTVDLSSSPPGRTDDYYTISLHSRHADDSLDGCNVVPEKTCLQRLAAKYQKKSSCQSHVRSELYDRYPDPMADGAELSCVGGKSRREARQSTRTRTVCGGWILPRPCPRYDRKVGFCGVYPVLVLFGFGTYDLLHQDGSLAAWDK